MTPDFIEPLFVYSRRKLFDKQQTDVTLFAECINGSTAYDATNLLQARQLTPPRGDGWSRAYSAFIKSITFHVPCKEFLENTWFEFHMNRMIHLTSALSVARFTRVMGTPLRLDGGECFDVQVRSSNGFRCPDNSEIYCAISGWWVAEGVVRRVSPIKVDVFMGDETLHTRQPRDLTRELDLAKVRILLAALAEKFDIPDVETLNDLIQVAKGLQK